MKCLRALLLLLALPCLPAAAAGFDPGFAPLTLEVGDLEVPYRVFSWFVMPNEAIRFTRPSAVRGLRMSSEHGKLMQTESGWLWEHAVPGGPYPLTLSRQGHELMRINVFVMAPGQLVRDGRLNGFRIDPYPAKPLKGLDIYRRPRGFVQVTEANFDTPVSPHFTLGQFVSKQSSGSLPSYLVLRPRLLLKLEIVLELLNQNGIRSDELHIMSGYRTPFYNRAIGNVIYSRHVWGGAADIFVDVNPRDGRMDDLNGDGRSDQQDAQWLATLIDRRFRQPDVAHLLGGLAKYPANPAHGPFVHIDVRGFRARW